MKCKSLTVFKSLSSINGNLIILALLVFSFDFLFWLTRNNKYFCHIKMHILNTFKVTKEVMVKRTNLLFLRFNMCSGLVEEENL